MLEKIHVTGFRSLRDFKLEIKPGLNVLVGPNGAGKTNIILFFDFVRAFTSLSLADAVGKSGGVAQIFSKSGKNKFSDCLSGEISGCVRNDNDGFYSYSLKFVIEFSAVKQNVHFLRQEILIDRHENESQGKVTRYAHIVYDYGQSGTGAGGLINFELAKNNKNRRHSFLDEEMKRLDQRGVFSQYCLSYFLSRLDDVISLVSEDFSDRLILNVIPSQVKKPEDVTREPGIDTDGSGLSATLYAIKKKKEIPFRMMPSSILRSRKFSSASWARLIDLVRVAVPSITDIEVESDPFDNLLRCRITVGSGSRKAILPLSAMSDGTVKWMSLVARLITSKDALLLEEPENYLHPLMQTEIVRLLRDNTNDSGFTIVSTHSETLLNAVRPDELVLVGYTSNGTVAKRVSNSKNIVEEINKTGFGLGYYYLADAVEVVE